MSTARQRRETSEGPGAWVILLGLMVLALAISWMSKGCGDDNGNANLGPTTTTPTTTAAGAGNTVINEINQTITQAGGIQFVTGSAELTPKSKSTLDAVAAILNKTTSVKAEINGHTDTQGAAEANMTLSKRRADTVLNYLVSKGVAATRLTAKGWGETAPLVPNDTTEDARAQNRRVEFKLAP